MAPALSTHGRLLALLAIGGAYAASWWAPVMDDDVGWQAFRVALSPIWAYESFGASDAWQGTVFVASALTNLVFLATFARVATQPAPPSPIFLWVIEGCAFLNLYWLARMAYDGDAGDLRIGYYLWIAAFGGLGAINAFDSQRARALAT